MNYDTMTKDALVQEIKRRRDNGNNISVDLRAGFDILIAALQIDDANTKAQTPTPLVDGSFENQLPKHPEMPSVATQPHDDVFAKGHKAKHNGDGFTYQVAHVEGELKPYKARIPKQASGHPGLYWEGSPEEYKEHFTRI